MVLSYDAYTETIQENNKVKDDIDELKQKQAVMLKELEKFNTIFELNPEFQEAYMIKHVPGYKPPKIMVLTPKQGKLVDEFLEKRKKEKLITK